MFNTPFEYKLKIERIPINIFVLKITIRVIDFENSND